MIVKETEVRKIVSEVLEIEEDTIEKGESLIDNYEADSLKILELLATLEKYFHITIPEAELKNMTTLENIVKILEQF